MYTKTGNRAQSIVEYLAVIIVILAAFIAMRAYYKRGLMGRYRQAGDSLAAGLLYETQPRIDHR